MSPEKQQALKLIESLPDQVTWDDIIYHFYVKKKIAEGLEAAERGEVVPHEKMKEEVLKRARSKKR